MDNTMSRRSMEQMAARRDRSGSLWLIQAFSGLILVVLLGMHMIVHHFVVEGGLRDYEQVMDYVATPAVFFVQVLFVITSVVHGLLGIRAIVIDMRPSAGALRAANWALGIVGALGIGWGIYLCVALQRMAG